MKINSLAILFLIAILLPANIVPAFSQTSSDNFENFLVELSLSPSHVDEHNSTHSVGYVNLVSKNGLAVKAPQDIAVGLESDDPSIVSVPTSVTIPKGHNFAIFDIQTRDKDGETTISTIFNDKIDFKNFKVGGADDSMPDGISLKINFPTNNMHVNSEMPFSVYLQTSDGDIIRAPYDIEIDLNYEKSLLHTSTEKMIIKKGTYYAWGIINTYEEVGNGFLRASFDRLGIDTSENIEITSSLPVALVIKTGEFGYYFREKMNLAGFEGREIMIGVSAKDLGIATEQFEAIQSLNIDNPFAENRTLSLFVLPQIPSKPTSILVYQIMAKGGGQVCTEAVNEEGETIPCIEEVTNIEEKN